MNETSIYGYIQSVFLPFMYPEIAVPDISIQANRLLYISPMNSITYTLNPGDVLETLLITPVLYDQYLLYARQALLLARINPSSTANLDSRYGFAAEIIQESDDSNSPAYIHQASAKIKATNNVRCQGVMYCRYPAATPIPTFETIINGTPKTDFVLGAGKELWINAVPTTTEKKALIVNVATSVTCVHYMTRITNNNSSVVQVTVSGRVVLERCRDNTKISPIVIRSSPFGFIQYIMEQLRNRYTSVIIDPNAIETQIAVRTELNSAIRYAIHSLVENWQGLLSGIPEVSYDEIINFIIFYLE